MRSLRVGERGWLRLSLRWRVGFCCVEFEFEFDSALVLDGGGFVMASLSLQRAMCESRSWVLRPFLQDESWRDFASELILLSCTSSVAISEARISSETPRRI